MSEVLFGNRPRVREMEHRFRRRQHDLCSRGDVNQAPDRTILSCPGPEVLIRRTRMQRRREL